MDERKRHLAYLVGQGWIIVFLLGCILGALIVK